MSDNVIKGLFENKGNTHIEGPATGFGGGGNDGGNDMRERIAKLEAGQDALRREIDLRFDTVDKKLDTLSSDIAKIPNEWALAKVVFFVVGALMAAAIWGPRALSLLSSTN